MSSLVTERAFFARPAPLVAPELLGKFLVRRWRGREFAHLITEVEAYHGHEDRASHASRGRTKRNEVMFGEPGRFYVYLVYGMYDMLNIVTGDPGEPSAGLIRGVQGYNGPGKLTRALHVGRSFNGRYATPKSGLWFEDRGVCVRRGDIGQAPRIGVNYAGPHWAAMPYRYYLTSDPVTP